MKLGNKLSNFDVITSSDDKVINISKQVYNRNGCMSNKQKCVKTDYLKQRDRIALSNFLNQVCGACFRP